MIGSTAVALLVTLMLKTRATPGQIRRAAGGKDPARLREAVEGWTCQELDRMASQDGKSALHMAAWQGCLENIALLLNMGCNPNVVATGTYSYGKTPIFFAATRCRNSVVQYLLEHSDASVTIVNNKGQSVLSIAASHLNEETIEAIQRAEHGEWINYRTTHSDGLEYGDLDPRFLDRDLRSTDVVTKLAINPTTKQSRRGNFARKNPHVVAREREKRVKQQRKPKKVLPTPSAEELAEQEEIWQGIESGLRQSQDNLVSLGLLLLRVVRFGETQRRSWIPDAATRLGECIEQSDSSTVSRKLLQDTVEALTGEDSVYERREMTLLEKWTQKALGERSVDDERMESSLPRQKVQSVIICLSSPPWRHACRGVCGLSSSLLVNPSRHEGILSLPEPPTWVDTEQGLCQLDETLRIQAQQSVPCVVALDTEWYTSQDDGITHASTIQVSVVSPGATPKLRTWVVDLLPTAQNDYHELIRKLLVWLFEDSNVMLLGFAFAHDMSKLRKICGALSSSRLLDVQRLAAQEMHLKRKTLPGLQACAAHCLYNQEYVLSKKEQCSDWARRPLSEAQVEYAGLDAAVLLVLLAEIAASKTSIMLE